MRDIFEVLFGASSGFGLFQLFSSPSHKIFIDRTSPKLADSLRKVKRKIYYKLVRDVKVRRFEILPSVRIHHKNRHIHIHHWITLSAILGIIFYKNEGITQLTLIKSFIAGGAIQGFLYKDRFKIFKKNEEAAQSANSNSATKGK